METKGQTVGSSSHLNKMSGTDKSTTSSHPCTKKKRRARNLGRRTPLPLRVLVLLGYVEIARRGLFLLYNVNDSSWDSRAKNAISVYTITYAIETLIAVYPGCRYYSPPLTHQINSRATHTLKNTRDLNGRC